MKFITQVHIWLEGVRAGIDIAGLESTVDVDATNSWDDGCYRITYTPDNPCADDEQRLLELASIIQNFRGTFKGYVTEMFKEGDSYVAIMEDVSNADL